MKDMVSKSHAKRRQDIKTKLMAAIAMLLVSSIMMVSSTYAWFTLSTAPEVTGITTAVGANGNLEMKLLPLNGDAEGESAEGDSLSNGVYKGNITWGNLVDLSDNNLYGFDKISLNPARLNLTDGKIDSVSPLATPEYGTDGRIDELKGNTITGVYDKDHSKSFVETIEVNEGFSGKYGVRAIGSISSMSAGELAYRAAKSAAITAQSRAKSLASQSLSSNGEKLAAIAVKKATGGADGYTKNDVDALIKMTSDLLGSIGQIESALINYSLAAELSAGENTDTIIADYAAITDIAALETRIADKTGMDGIKAAIAALKTTKGNVTTAKSELEALGTAESYTWEQIRTPLQKLADPEKMKINGIQADQINADWVPAENEVIPSGYYQKDGTGPYYYMDGTTEKKVTNMTVLPSRIMEKGLTVTIDSNGGVYADIADHCGDYQATVTISSISAFGMSFTNLKATMQTKTIYGKGDADPLYLNRAANNVPGYNSGAGASTASGITDFYGYIIDLAFRTNAVDSSLVLQQDAVDRVYEDNTTNDATMGGGAYMEFASDSDTFGNDRVKSLMASIRVVFFQTNELGAGEIVGYARLDTATADETGTGVKMLLRMCDAGGTWAENQNIMELTENQATKLSVLVYLDGDSVKNKDVAFDSAQSMSGKMNLQFSSTADLKPMENSDVRNPSAENNNQTPATPTPEQIEATGDVTSAVYVEVDGQGYVVVIGQAADATVKIDNVEATHGEIGGQSGHYVEVDSKPATVAVTVTPATP